MHGGRRPPVPAGPRDAPLLEEPRDPEEPAEVLWAIDVAVALELGQLVAQRTLDPRHAPTVDAWRLGAIVRTPQDGRENY